MQDISTVKPYFSVEPQFDTWLGKPLSEEGTYESDEGALTEWYNGVHWNARIRVKSGSSQLMDDLVVEGCSKNRAIARLEAERDILTKLMGLTNNANILGVLGVEFKF